MASNELQPAVVDVPVGSLNQLPPNHAGPTGRLTQLYDAIIRRHADNGSKRVTIDPRTGFQSLVDELRNSTTGIVEAGTWANPSFLAALGDQLLSICTNRPRVYNGSSWTNYDSVRVVNQKLSQSVLHATNGTIAAPDHAYIAGVTCSCWTEQEATSDGDINTSLWVGFRADDGAWVTVPQKRYEALGGSDLYMLGKVVSNGSNFWLFYNAESSGHKIFIEVYDTNGFLVTSGNVTRKWDTSPGYWDVYGSPLAGIWLAQPNSFGMSPADYDVEVTKFSLVLGSIDSGVAVLTDASCEGPVAWLTNDLTGSSVYLGTIGPTEISAGRLWAYEISSALAITKIYDFGTEPFLLPDNLTGWAEETGVANERNVYLSYSQLAGPALSSGPPFDPQTRFIATYKRTFAGVTSHIRTTQSVIQQSRAFAINSEYHAYTYYQSGSGQALPSGIEDYECDDGDYFIGPPTQPIEYTSGNAYGAPRNATVARISIGLAPTSGAIDGGGTPDKVEVITSSGLANVPDGTILLKWTFKNGSFGTGRTYSILDVDGSDIPSANFQWDIVAGSTGGVCYTPTTSRVSGTVVPGNFGTQGTVETIQVAQYTINNLEEIIPDGTIDLFTPQGEIEISGATDPDNDGTFDLIERNPLIYLAIDTFVPGTRALFTLYTTQAQDDAFSGDAIVSPSRPNGWGFLSPQFTAADEDCALVITDNPVDVNNSIDGFPVETVLSSTLIETEATATQACIAQIFETPFPNVSLVLDDPSSAYTLHVEAIDFDYTYVKALLTIDGAVHASDNGVYEITDIIDEHTVRLKPTNGRTDQRNESFSSSQTIFIQRGTNVQEQTQPTWFVTPLTGSQPQVGCFEKGLAFADWRFDGEPVEGVPNFGPQDRYRFALSSTSNPFGTIRQVVLPYRVGSFTQVAIATVGGTDVNIANTASASTIGLKVFRSQGRGEGTGDAGKLLIPGLLAAEFTASGFAESNFNVGPEAPFIVSQAEDTNTTFALTPRATYVYAATISRTLENGDTVRTLASAPIVVTLTGDNNVINLGGRLISPLTTGGLPVTRTYGLTNHSAATYEIWRSVVVDGVPSTQLHLITNPANPNGMYTSGTGSGFTFPDNFTWNYRDENPDAGIRATEILYQGSLGQGIAPHFPCPAFSHATTWANRRWVVGYDGAVWMSAELVEGEDPWFFPGFRYPFPPEDPAVCVVGFENFLFMFCAKSVWRIPLVELPNATLTSGAMPAPVRLPFAMGCSGFAVAMPDFVAYSSSVNEGRQIWAITRQLQNIYLSEPIEDFFAQPVSGLAVDGQQRLCVLSPGSYIPVFDPVAREWSVWRMPSAPDLITSYVGAPTYQDSGFVMKQHPSAIVDTRDDVETPVCIDVTFADLSFAAVRAVKRLWEVQIVGIRNGGCNINAIISYPDEVDESPTVFGPEFVTDTPMLYAFNPSVEDTTSWRIRVFSSYEDIDPEDIGSSFSIEMLCCEVGLDSRQGLRKLPNGFRLVG